MIRAPQLEDALHAATAQADIERQQQPTPITARSQGSGCPKNGWLDIRVIVTTFRRLALR
jgi:hypothetical protein